MTFGFLSVFQDNWSIPYKREESLGRCLVSATNLARENLMEADDNCKKFIDRVMPEAFRFAVYLISVVLVVYFIARQGEQTFLLTGQISVKKIVMRAAK